MLEKRSALLGAQGRLDYGPPVAVIDIGSNSVRLVVYEGLARAPTPLFNEKTLAGLGRQVHTTGMMPQDAVDKALAALRRFRALCNTMQVGQLWVLATAACREARNGPEFIVAAERICCTKIDVVSGKREAELTALGVISGFHRPDGVVGDLGGGSLELVDVRGTRLKPGISLPLGGLALQDRSGKSVKKAGKIVEQALSRVSLKTARGRSLYAVGGTWRSLARLHMAQTGYPLHVMHGYVMRAKEVLEFVRLLQRVNPETLSQIDVVNSARRPLLPFAALVLEQLVKRARPKDVVFSALGLREGLLYSRLDPEQRKQDALLSAAQELNILRSRSPRHGKELVVWSDRFMKSSGIDETAEERRLRHAACLLADIGWRAHPDYRGEQSLNVLAHGSFVGIDHPGRAFLALAVFFRHVSAAHDEELSPRLRELASTRMLDRARVLGASMRVAYLVSASQPGILPRAPLKVEKNKLVLRLESDCAELAGDRVMSRLKQLARLVGREPAIVVA